MRDSAGGEIDISKEQPFLPSWIMLPIPAPRVDIRISKRDKGLHSGDNCQRRLLLRPSCPFNICRFPSHTRCWLSHSTFESQVGFQFLYTWLENRYRTACILGVVPGEDRVLGTRTFEAVVAAK